MLRRGASAACIMDPANMQAKISRRQHVAHVLIKAAHDDDQQGPGECILEPAGRTLGSANRHRYVSTS